VEVGAGLREWKGEKEGEGGRIPGRGLMWNEDNPSSARQTAQQYNYNL
jgi:hypothetical protein